MQGQIISGRGGGGDLRGICVCVRVKQGRKIKSEMKGGGEIK